MDENDNIDDRDILSHTLAAQLNWKLAESLSPEEGRSILEPFGSMDMDPEISNISIGQLQTRLHSFVTSPNFEDNASLREENFESLNGIFEMLSSKGKEAAFGVLDNNLDPVACHIAGYVEVGDNAQGKTPVLDWFVDTLAGMEPGAKQRVLTLNASQLLNELDQDNEIRHRLAPYMDEVVDIFSKNG